MNQRQFLNLCCLLAVPVIPVSNGWAEKTSLPSAHTSRNIEGWTIRVDNRLLKGENAAVGERALKLLAARLVAITIVMPEKSPANPKTPRANRATTTTEGLNQ